MNQNPGKRARHKGGWGSAAVRFGRRLAREWRRMGTGLCFVTFMLSGLFLALTVYPLLRLLPLRARLRKRVALGIVQKGFRLFMGYMQAWRVITRFRVEGLQNLPGNGPFLFIANHPTLIDVVAILGVLPRCNCIVKKALWHSFYLGGVMRQAGFLPNDTGMVFIRSVEKCFAEGYSLMVFPEGTRSPPGDLGSFNRGAAQVALRTGVTVIPIRVECEPLTLIKGEPWYRVPPRSVTFTLRIFAPLDMPRQVLEKKNTPLKVRSLTRYFESFYRELLGLPRSSSRSGPDPGGETETGRIPL